MTSKLILKRDWRLRLIEATHDKYAPRGQRRSLMGCIVLAALGKRPGRPPYLVGKSLITEDGRVLCDFVDGLGYHHAALVCQDDKLVQNVMGLVRHCDLDEAERIEFLARINNWIGKDLRDKSRIRKVMVVE
jgi:hypothetical protein